MRGFAGDTNTVYTFDLDPEVRAYFSATGARFKDQLWLRVETRWVASGAPIHVILSSFGEGVDPETLVELDGTIADDLWEKQWTVDLPMERLDEIAGPIYLTFAASIDGVPEPARSQTLLLHRTRFSS
jgi:hypothetical protein